MGHSSVIAALLTTFALVGCRDAETPARFSDAMLGRAIDAPVLVAPEAFASIRRATGQQSSGGDLFAGLTACSPSSAGDGMVFGVLGAFAGGARLPDIALVTDALVPFLDGVAHGRVLPCCGTFHPTQCQTTFASWEPFVAREATVTCSDAHGNALGFLIVDEMVRVVQPLPLVKTALAVAPPRAPRAP